MKYRWIGDNVYGHSGYANNVRELFYAMSQLGADAKVVCPKPPDGAYIPPKCEGIVTDTLEVDGETHLGGRTYQDCGRLLTSFAGKARSLSAIIVLEGDRLPQDWIAVANCMDLLWTASEYGRRQFIANGIVPELIRVVPHGIDPEIFHPMPHVKREADMEGEFVFLFVGGFAIPGDRKGCDILAHAFALEFKPEEKATLLLKVNPTYGWTDPYAGTKTSAEYLAKLTAGHRKIALIPNNATQDQLAELYNLSDIHVMPSLGEAFSMNLAESMACARTVVTTNWSGPLDYCRPEFSYLVDVERFVPAHYGPWDVMAGSRWAVPSLEHLRETLRYVYDNQGEVKRNGRKAQRFILDNYLWRHAAEKTIRALKEAE